MIMPTAPATKRQTWAVFCMTGWDVRNCELTKERASELIDSLKAGKAFLPDDWPGARQVRKTAASTRHDWQALYDKAVAAAEKAYAKCVPVPMVVAQHSNMADDNSPIEKSWFVEGGVCGFAWVTIHPGTCSFARWLVKHDLGSKAYRGGVSVWAGPKDQSMARKTAWAKGFAGVVGDAGIKCYVHSQID